MTDLRNYIWTSRQAAQFLGIAPNTVRNLARLDMIPAQWVDTSLTGEYSGKGKRNQWRFNPAEMMATREAWRAGKPAPRLHGPRKPRDPDTIFRKVDLAEHEHVAQMYEQGMTLQAIGDTYGITRERVRQILAIVRPGLSPRHMRRQRYKNQADQNLSAKFLAQCQRALDEDRHCRVCGGWVIRDTEGENITCSEDCADHWHNVRILDQHNKHRRQMARAYLKRPEKYRESMLKWARAILSDNPPPPNRRFFYPGSAMAESIMKFRRDEFIKIVLQMRDRSPGKEYWLGRLRETSQEDQLPE